MQRHPYSRNPFHAGLCSSFLCAHLQALQWQVTPPTIPAWLDLLLPRAFNQKDVDSKFASLFCFISEVCSCALSHRFLYTIAVRCSHTKILDLATLDIASICFRPKVLAVTAVTLCLGNTGSWKGGSPGISFVCGRLSFDFFEEKIAPFPSLSLYFSSKIEACQSMSLSDVSSFCSQYVTFLRKSISTKTSRFLSLDFRSSQISPCFFLYLIQGSSISYSGILHSTPQHQHGTL